MYLEPLQRHVNAEDLPLDQLAGNQAVSNKDKLDEASRQFEALLLRQVLAEAQKPTFGSALVKDSAAASIYRGMITNQLAEAISKSGGFGLAKMLEPQLEHQLITPDSKADTTKKPDVASTSEMRAATPFHWKSEPGGFCPATLPTSGKSQTQFVEPPEPVATGTPPHAALLMLQLGRSATHQKSHD